jgi:hypothetical protein
MSIESICGDELVYTLNPPCILKIMFPDAVTATGWMLRDMRSRPLSTDRHEWRMDSVK